MPTPLADNQTGLTPDAISNWVAAHEGWSERSGHLIKEFHFPDFIEAFAFMARCACVFEVYDHHPMWSNVFSRVKVQLWTHRCKAVTARDLQLAERLDSFDHGAMTQAA